MSESMPVRLFDSQIGELSIGGDRTPEDWRFTYSATATADLSLSMPRRDATYEGAIVRNWFCNLLPEGSVRDAISDRLRLSRRDDFGLLAAIGGECAGAVSVGQLAESTSQPQQDLEELLLHTGSQDDNWALAGTPRRLSLAGAQDKLAVVRNSDGRLLLPAAGAISTHILKPDSLRLRGLTELEAFGLRLASSLELNVTPCEIVSVAGRKALLVARYDRVAQPNGELARLHQEDCCQALGLPGEFKYQEARQSPSLAAISNLIRNEARLGPEALSAFVDWMAFNAIIGNADAHAKNLSILSNAEGVRHLAPVYDSVPTIALPESLIAREPALRLGIAKKIDAVSLADWRIVAGETGFAPGFLVSRVRAMAEAIHAKAPEAAESLAESGDTRVLHRARDAVRLNAERMLG
jgi:serine/threonine-protein kinase HipA